MPMKTFINLPVRDLDRAVSFFTALGFSFDADFTDEKATSMIINEHSYAMLLTEPFFAGFTSKELADATKSTEVITAVSVDSREEVDTFVEKARAAGASHIGEPFGEGPMYGCGFADPDGHQWEVFYMQMD